MLNIGTPDLTFFRGLQRSISHLKNDLAVTSREAVTGRREDLTVATGGNIGNAHLLQKSLNDVTAGQQRLALVEGRISLIDGALEATRNITNNIGVRSLSALSIGDQIGFSAISREAEADLSEIFAVLRVRQGDRNLFSGDATTATPLAPVETLLADVQGIIASAANSSDAITALDTYFNDPAGGFETTIYQGGSNPVAHMILPDGSKIGSALRANDTSLKDVLRGLATFAALENGPFSAASSEYEVLYRNASENSTRGEAALIKVQADLGVASGQVTRSQDRLSQERLVTTKAFEAIVGRDQYEAATRLSQIETQLQAAFAITARLSNLSLTNYL